MRGYEGGGGEGRGVARRETEGRVERRRVYGEGGCV